MLPAATLDTKAKPRVVERSALVVIINELHYLQCFSSLLVLQSVVRLNISCNEVVDINNQLSICNISRDTYLSLDGLQRCQPLLVHSFLSASTVELFRCHQADNISPLRICIPVRLTCITISNPPPMFDTASNAIENILCVSSKKRNQHVYDKRYHDLEVSLSSTCQVHERHAFNRPERMDNNSFLSGDNVHLDKPIATSYLFDEWA